MARHQSVFCQPPDRCVVVKFIREPANSRFAVAPITIREAILARPKVNDCAVLRRVFDGSPLRHGR